jgi:uncharacterized membrane protein
MKKSESFRRRVVGAFGLTLVFSIAVFGGADVDQSAAPFWKSKPHLLKKIRDERAVIVSVRNEEISREPRRIRFSIQGVGIVSRPPEICFRMSQQYHRLPLVSEHFKTVSFDPSKSELFLVTEALGYQARMILKMNPVHQSKGREELKWEVVWGHFKGMRGVIGFEPVSSNDGARTEMSLESAYESEELPLPKVLMGFALEVVTQKVAEKMRTFIERQPIAVLDQPAPLAKPPAFMWPTLETPVSPKLEKAVPGSFLDRGA